MTEIIEDRNFKRDEEIIGLTDCGLTSGAQVVATHRKVKVNAGI